MSSQTYCRLNPKTDRLEMTVVLDLPEDISSKTELFDIFCGSGDHSASTHITSIVNQVWTHIQRFRILKPEEKK